MWSRPSSRAEPIWRCGTSGEYTPLHRAAEKNNNPEVARALVQAGASLEARNQWNYTPMHRAAAENSNPAVLETLIEEGRRRLGAPERAGRNLGSTEAEESSADQSDQ